MRTVQLVGILNVTPDSFSDGDPLLTPAKVIERAEALFAEGASIVDVGAEATNPYVKPLTSPEEWQRLEPILGPLLKKYPGKVSLDTYHAETAAKALELGPLILNDVTTFRDQNMVTLAAKYNVRCIVSHLPFSAKTIGDAHTHAIMNDVHKVKAELLQRRGEMVDAGIKSENIILDPGIGFGKSMELNKRLLGFAKEVPGLPVLIGHSRKRFLGKDRFSIEPNLAAARVAVDSGALYLRVHEVAPYLHLLNQE